LRASAVLANCLSSGSGQWAYRPESSQLLEKQRVTLNSRTECVRTINDSTENGSPSAIAFALATIGGSIAVIESLYFAATRLIP
jgi:hypothetical protein